MLETVVPNVFFFFEVQKSCIPVKSFWTVRFLMFFKKVSSVHQACIYLIQSTSKTIKFQNIFTISNNSFLLEYILKCNLFLWFQRLIFSIITPVTWSFRNHSNILICCSKNIYYYYYYYYYYVENSWAEFCQVSLNRKKNLKYKSFVTLQMSLSSLLINLKYPC